MSPTEKYCDWFESLAPAVAEELALSLMQLCPGGALQPSIITGSPTVGFVARLKRLASATPFSDAGLAVTLVSLTDFAFLERSSAEQWEKNRTMLEMLDEAQQKFLESDQLSDWIEKSRLRHPLRARQWVKEFEGWRRVRTELSPERIRNSLLER